MKHEPFDPEDPKDIVADNFRKEVMLAFLNAGKVTLFRELSEQDKLEAFMAGALTGCLVVALTHFKPENWEKVHEAAVATIKEARHQAEGIVRQELKS
jgi:HD-like signal output (HDOD) protein